MSKAGKVEIFTPRNRLAEKAVERDEPAEKLISNAASTVAALGDEIGPQLGPEIRKLGERLAAFAGEGSSNPAALEGITREARQLSEVADTLGYTDAGQILCSLQELLAGAASAGLTPKVEELARLHIAALERLSAAATSTADGDQGAHPVAHELERAARQLIEKQP